MGILDKMFLPKQRSNEFTIERYMRDIERGEFRNLMNLGVCEDKGGNWLLKDFSKEPNALFIGAMGSGKSVAANFSIQTWMLANSDQTVLFIADTLKGANDYQALFDYDQVYPILSSEAGIHRVLDLLYDEVMFRRDAFNEVQAENIDQYEKKMTKLQGGKEFKLARCFLVVEEFHAIPYVVLNYDKDYKIDLTSAFKFHQLMKIGRSYGVWIIACSQKGTKSDIPSEIVQNFTQKQIFRVSKAEASYFLSETKAAEIRSDQKGRCETDYGTVQFPFVPMGTQKILLEKYMKPLEAKCLYLNDQLIEDYLKGKSTVDLYKHKKLSDLCSSIESREADLVIRILHEKLGHKVQPIDARIDPYGISLVVDWPNKGKVAVMVRVGSKKITGKHLLKLSKGMESYGCMRGILYTSAEDLPSGIYKVAVDQNIEIVDHEDLIRLARQIELRTKQGEEVEISPDKLADESKETGEYQKDHDIEDESVELPPDTASSLVETEEERGVEVKEESALIKKDKDGELKVVEEEGHRAAPTISPDLKPKYIEKVEPTKKESEKQLDELFSKEKPLSDGEKTEDEKDEPAIMPEIEESIQKAADSMLTTSIRASVKPVKRVAVRVQFYIRQDEVPELLIHLQKNTIGDVYRVLFHVMVGKQIRHKYFLDRQVKGEFTLKDKAKLQIDTTEEWNSQRDEMNGRAVFSNDEFEKEVLLFFDQFKPYEFGNVKTVCWKEDVEFVKRLVAKSRYMDPNPTVIEDMAQAAFGSNEMDREILVAQNGMTVKRLDIFAPIEMDFQIWRSLNPY